MLHILHLSDLHFGDDHFWGDAAAHTPELAQVLAPLCKQAFSEADTAVLIASGDIATAGTASDYSHARRFFTKLSEGVPSIKHLLIVPGNHDVLWKDEHGNRIPRLDPRRLRDYQQFVSDLKRDLNARVTVLSPEGSGATDTVCTLEFPGGGAVPPVLLVGLNSVTIESEEHAAMGLVGYAQRQQLSGVVRDWVQQHGTSSIVVVVLHHHVLPVTYLDPDYFTKGRVSLLLDARALLDGLGAAPGRAVLIHGHGHQPALVSWRNRLESDHSMVILGAGSVGAKLGGLGPVGRRHFILCEFDDAALVVKGFATSANDETQFIPDDQSSAECSWAELALTSRDCLQLRPARSNMLAQTVTPSDGSDLFLVFMNVVDCKRAREKIKAFADSYGHAVQIEALYDLYGQHDCLMKYRCRSEDGKDFWQKLERHLRWSNQGGELRAGRSVRYMDVWTEDYNLVSVASGVPSQERTFIVPVSTQDYERTGRMRAFIVVERCNDAQASQVVGELCNAIAGSGWDVGGAGISSIVHAVYVDGQGNLVLELDMRCSQVHLLNRLSECIERVIDHRGADKYTHIAYACETQFGDGSVSPGA